MKDSPSFPPHATPSGRPEENGQRSSIREGLARALIFYILPLMKWVVVGVLDHPHTPTLLDQGRGSDNRIWGALVGGGLPRVEKICIFTYF